jgi:hypothetical protein
MKAVQTIMAVGLVLLAWSPVTAVRADTSPRNNFVYAGVVEALDDKEDTLTVKWLVLKKRFNIAKDCAFVVASKKNPGLADLRIGQSAEVSYEEVDGVPVAHRVVQTNPAYVGFIESVDREARTLTVTKTSGKRTFKLADDCYIAPGKNSEGTFNDLKPGHKIVVTYEKSEKTFVAHRLESKSVEFSGVIRAIDVPARTVKVQALLSTRKFNLARNCAISIDGNPKAKLADLRIGQSVTMAYAESSGVYIAHHLGTREVVANAGNESFSP